MADNNTLTVPGIFDKLINTGADVPDLSKNIQGIPDYNYLGSNPVNLRMPSLGGSLPASSENNPVSQGIKDLFSKQPSFNTMAQSTEFNPEQVDVERYKSSPDFFKLGVSLSDNNEEKYGQNQSWSEVLGNGLTGMKNLAYNGFVDNVRGWGRMTDALVSWDWSKLKGDPMSMMELDNNMKKIMNDNPIYATEKGTETFWNRETFGNFLQQSGFTLGAIAEIVAEQAITKMIEGGLAASGIGAAGAGAMELAEEANTASKVGRLAKFFNKSKEFFDAAKNFKALKAAGDIWKSDSVVNAVLNGIGDISMQVAKRVPVVDLGLDIHRAGKAGATSLELAKIGVGGVKRLLSESNFAFTEARMEAAGTYTDLVNQMNADYYTRNGVYAQGTDLEKINEKAMKAADGNFNFNSAILFTSNRIMFDNLFKGSKATSKMLSAFGEELEDGSLKVFGKINNRPTVRLYEGAIKDFGKISSDFGRTKALTVAGKSIMANSLKFEAIEGIQELLQEGSNEYFKDYYMDAYKATYNPLISPDSEKSLDEAIASQKNMQGLKTFASGALTGMLIHGPTVLVTKSLQKASDKITTYNDTKNLSPEKKAEYLKNKEERKKAGEEFRNNFNALAKDPSKFFAEHVKNFNTQKEGSDALALAAKLGDKFAYENVRTDMMHNILMQAVANNTHEALVDTMRSYGQNMTKEEFEQAFVGMEYSSPNKKTAQDYVNKVADSIESYVNTREKLMDKYGHIANPNKFTFGSKLWFDETIKYKTLNNYIDILAGNEFKAANALQRSTDLFQKAAANKNLGSSLANAFQILGSERNMQQEMAVLKAELTNKKGQLDAATSADDKIAIQKEIDLKQDQLDALESWNTNKENMMDADKTTASYEAFKKYVDLKNKEAGKDQVVNLQDVEDHYLDFIDYIKLNRKAQDHTDAINFLINPENFKTLHDRLQNGAKDAYFDLLKDAGYDYIKNNSVNENEHFIIHSNGYYGVYSSKGELIIVVGSQENANNIKKQLDEALNKTDNSDQNLDESDEDFTDELISDFENKQAGKKETSTQSTELEDFMMAEYMAAKKAAEAQGKTIPDYEAWKKAAGKYVEQRFNRMKNSSSTPTTSSTETTAPVSNIETEKADIERRRQEELNKHYEGLTAIMAREDAYAGDDKISKEINAKYDAELEALEGKPIENETLTSVKLGKYTIEVGDLVNGKEVLSITPTHIIQDGVRNPVTYSEMKSKLDTFDGNNITKKADIKPTSKVNVLENGQIDNPGETNNTLRKTASQSSKNIQEANPKLFGAGSPKVIPAASKVNNRSDNYEEVTKGNKTFRSRTDVNEKYPVFIATTAFGIGDALTLEVDYNIENFEGRDGIVQKEDFFTGNKIKESVKEEFPIAIYTVHNGEKVKIGYVPTVSWLQERWADDSTKNVVETLSDKDGNEINNLEIQTKELIKLREKIFENHNKNPNFVQNAIVNNKSEGVLRVMETGKEKLSTNLNANDIQMGVIRNGNIQVSGTRSLSDEVGEESIIINIDELENKDGWPVVILPTPTGKRLVSYVSIPKLEEKDQDLVIESWKAFQKMQDDNYTPTKYELDLVKAIYSQLNVEYIDGEKPSFNILKDYFNSYITFQSGRRLDPTMNQGTSQMNITAEGGLFIWVRDNNDPEQVLEIKNVADLEKKDAVLRDKLSKLYYNVRLSENNSMGIGNQNTYSMITLERNADNSFRIKLNDMTYKQHLMNTLETNIDKGVPVDEKNPKSPWVYFANPVVTYDLSNSSTLEAGKKEAAAVEEITISEKTESVAAELGLDLSLNTDSFKTSVAEFSDDELRDMFNECNPG